MSRWLYYVSLGWRDLTRLWPTTQHHIIIVAGICLPILLLLGLKRGHVETLRRDLVTSPTGRQVTFWSARKGELMDRESIDRLASELPSVELIIPETQRVVSLSSGEGGEQQTVESVTLFPCRSGDPLLKQLKVAVPRSGSSEILLGDSLARQLKLGVGDNVEVILTRGRNESTETVSAICELTGVIPTQEAGAAIGYADLDLIDQFEAYARGYKVDALGWPSAKTPAPDKYSSYYVFCEAGNDLSDDDRIYLRERGFELQTAIDRLPAELVSILVEDWRDRLIIYEIFTKLSKTSDADRLRIAPSQLSEATSADDVIVAWNEPLKLHTDAGENIAIGLSMSKRTWLREYFKDPEIAFNYDAPSLSAKFTANTTSNTLAISLSSNGSVSVNVAPVAMPAKGNNLEDLQSKDPSSPTAEETGHDVVKGVKSSVVVLPADLLSWLHQERSQLVQFDEQIALFVAKPQKAVYDRARLYASTIDHVPAVVTALSAKNFAVMSETGRITEIQQQDNSLQLLVWVVGAGVFFFGIITVFSVLMDATDRKRATVGILRVMGVSRSGIFLTILLRSAVIGVAAALASIAVGFGISQFLAWIPPSGFTWIQMKPVVAVSIATMDLVLVAGGAVVCCCLGAIPPAWKASRLDPFDAIVEGRFH